MADPKYIQNSGKFSPFQFFDYLLNNALSIQDELSNVRKSLHLKSALQVRGVEK